MSAYRVIGSGLLGCVLLAHSAGAAVVTGVVQCDANQNLTNDSADVPIPGVLVVVTNFVGGFSNATYTAANGSFALTIPNFDPFMAQKDPRSQTYVETLAGVSLPPGSTIVLPQPLTYLNPAPAYFIDFGPTFSNVIYTSASGTSSNGNWLLNTPSCQSALCGVKGSGTLRNQGKLLHSFGGDISPVPSLNGIHPGHWTHIAQQQRLEFNATLIQSVMCGSVTNQSGVASSMNLIQFNGRGTLKGIRGNQALFNPVFFVVQVEDLSGSHHGPDQYYLRVMGLDGTTLLLVSGDAANPEDVAPAPISTGNLHIRTAVR